LPKKTTSKQEQGPASGHQVQFTNQKQNDNGGNTSLSQPSHPQTTADCTGSRPQVSRMVGCFSRGKSTEGKRMGLHEENSCPVQLKN